MTNANRISLTLALAAACLAAASSDAAAQTQLNLPPIDLTNPGDSPAGIDFGDSPAPAPDGSDAPAAPDAPASPATPGAPDSPADDGDTAAGWQQKFFAINWRRIAPCYADIDDRFLVVPAFDPRSPSSFGQTPDQWLAERTKTQRVSAAGGLVRTQKVGPARDEALAVTTRLPDLKPGSYGHIDSVKIVRVVSPTEMLVTDLRLLDPDRVARQKESDRNMALRNSTSVIDAKVRQEEGRLKESYRARSNDDSRSNSKARSNDDIDDALARYRDKAIAEQKKIVDDALEDRFKERDRIVQDQAKLAGATIRLLGFPTAGQREGARWSGTGGIGPQIAVVNVPADKTDPDARGRNKTITALNGDLLEKGLTEEQFRKLLASRGLTVETFAELARPIMREHPADSRPRVVDAIEKFGALTAAADNAAEKPADAPRPSRTSKPADNDFFDNK